MKAKRLLCAVFLGLASVLCAATQIREAPVQVPAAGEPLRALRTSFPAVEVRQWPGDIASPPRLRVPIRV